MQGDGGHGGLWECSGPDNRQTVRMSGLMPLKSVLFEDVLKSVLFEERRWQTHSLWPRS